MTMKHAIRTIGTVLFLTVFIGQVEAQKVGTSSLQFLKVMPTARGTAMGDAFVSLATGADATFWNPAGLTRLTNHEMTSTLTMWLLDTKQLALAYGVPMGDWGTLGFQFQYIDYGSIDETRADNVDLVVPAVGEPFFNAGLTGRSFTPYSYLVGLSYARAFTDKFSAALTVKYAKESLWSDQAISIVNNVTGEVATYKTYADVILFDFGMLYNTGFRSVHVGVAAQNFGPQVTFADKPHPAPMAFRLGVSANVFGQEGLLFQDESNRLTVAYDLFQPNDYRQQMHVGAEYAFSEFLALRAGYKFDYDSEGLTYGGGIHTDASGWPVRVDYSYGSMGEFLNSVHRISLGVHFR
jgi:long-subunit fatty acid transport protein